MTSRVQGYDKISPINYQKLLDWYLSVKKSDVDPVIRELVLIRCSQINHCLFCLDLHTKDARKAGETEKRIYALNAWREASFFTDKEKGALEWAEAVTLVNETQVPDAVYDAVKPHFSDKELIDLTMLIAGINAWNRLGVAFRSQPPKD
jgi:AhpD family alkylhydroperoxidase